MKNQSLGLGDVKSVRKIMSAQSKRTETTSSSSEAHPPRYSSQNLKELLKQKLVIGQPQQFSEDDAEWQLFAVPPDGAEVEVLAQNSGDEDNDFEEDVYRQRWVTRGTRSEPFVHAQNSL